MGSKALVVVEVTKQERTEGQLPAYRVAQILGYGNPNSVRAMANRGAFERVPGAHGRYDLSSVLKYREARLSRRARRPVAPTPAEAP
jgi:hypothetical protein